ncbi:putative Zinc metalloproteinase nas-4 [Hypsibius exemplaris]|uniref:Metalloendopeptidase n=1 Tax=Hypsibius exemplaris TaxID=2072580 RepID=A0A1W0WK98_HYPEX|nr:putative Zinc metalloproteinase nas-4 [Hypsibius exemplaris]
MSGICIWIILVAAVACGFAKPIERTSEDLSEFINGLPENIGSEYNEGLFEGDITGVNEVMTRNGILDVNFLWRYRRVYYVIHERFSAEDRVNIEEAMAEYHRKTCIRFVPLPDMADRPPWMDDYLIIAMNQTGCHSYVGRRGGVQLLNLQNPGCMSRGTILHELMHAVGFWHEQSRPDRDDYVTIVAQNIPANNLHNFNAYNWNTVTILDEPYDYESVMHYDAYAFTNTSNAMTIVPKLANAKLGQRLDFSVSDVKKINRRYACT